MSDITELLREAGDDDVAANRLHELIYAELRGIARNQLRAERSDHTLQATALAHEVYLKLLGQQSIEWQNRAQFFAIASRATRRILVDHARARLRLKRGGGAAHTSLSTDLAASAPGSEQELVALDDALTRLKSEDPTKCQIVEMRYFGGFSATEIASVLGVSSRTVDRHWQYARAWLYRQLREEDTNRG